MFSGQGCFLPFPGHLQYTTPQKWSKWGKLLIFGWIHFASLRYLVHPHQGNNWFAPLAHLHQKHIGPWDYPGT